MKVLEKTVELGEMSFKVRTNRDIAVASYEKYPEVLAYALKHNGKENLDMVKIVENKGLSELYRVQDQVGKMIEYALPLMLKEAGDKSDAKKIIEYARDNDALGLLNTGLLGFIGEAFTQGELVAKPKIKFSMK